MTLKDQKIETLRGQVEALRMMPEGSPLGDGSGRVMSEMRRGLYLRQAEGCLRTADATPEHLFSQWEHTNLLLHDDFME